MDALRLGFLHVIIYEVDGLPRWCRGRCLKTNVHCVTPIENGVSWFYATIILDGKEVASTRRILCGPSSNPRWNQFFHIYGLQKASNVKFAVTHVHPNGTILIGRASVPVEELSGERVNKRLAIRADEKNPVSAGSEIHVKLQYFDVDWANDFKSQEFRGVLHGCKNCGHQDTHTTDNEGKNYEPHGCWEHCSLCGEPWNKTVERLCKAMTSVLINGWHKNHLEKILSKIQDMVLSKCWESLGIAASHLLQFLHVELSDISNCPSCTEEFNRNSEFPDLCRDHRKSKRRSMNVLEDSIKKCFAIKKKRNRSPSKKFGMQDQLESMISNILSVVKSFMFFVGENKIRCRTKEEMMVSQTLQQMKEFRQSRQEFRQSRQELQQRVEQLQKKYEQAQERCEEVRHLSQQCQLEVQQELEELLLQKQEEQEKIKLEQEELQQKLQQEETESEDETLAEMETEPNMLADLQSELESECHSELQSQLQFVMQLLIQDLTQMLLERQSELQSYELPKLQSLVQHLVLSLVKLQSNELTADCIFEKNISSVVYISYLECKQSSSGSSDSWESHSSGSGFVWDKNGHIVTNYHVIQVREQPWLHLGVTFSDTSTCHAELVGFDRYKDIAVLRAVKEQLSPIRKGTSANLREGQKVYAIGNPFGKFPDTFTDGIISGFRGELWIDSTCWPVLQDFIQTNAAINPGNSGGPLLDRSGKLIGMNTAIFSPCPSPYSASCGLGFAIRVDALSVIVDQLIKFGRVTRPILGIKTSPEQSVIASGMRGVPFSDAPANGPAGKAGLRPSVYGSDGRLCALGDVITSINGKLTNNGLDLYKILDQCKVGDEVTVEFLPDNRTKISERLQALRLDPEPDETQGLRPMTITVRLEQRPDETPNGLWNALYI